MKKAFISFYCLIVVLGACQRTKTCKYKPEPIFEKGLPHVIQYNFEKQGTQSLESLLLDTGVLLEIGQDVCEATKQEYRFIVKGDYSKFPDSLWLKEASKELVFISALSPKQSGLKAWADIIEQRRQDMKIGQDREVEPGIFVRVDKVVSPDQSTLIVLFSQQ
jgi:hypothetical protein